MMKWGSWTGLTGDDVDHVAVVLRRWYVRFLLLLDPRLEQADSSAVDVARHDADARMLCLRVLLQLKNQPVPLFL